jgi:transposase
MKIKETVGIDVSKLTLDATIHSTQSHLKCENNIKGFEALLKWVKSNSLQKETETLYIFEHTGLYSHQLSIYLNSKEVAFSMISGLEIKRSLGITRGKDDKVDSKIIARYGYRLRDEIKLFKIVDSDISKLKRLLTLRERLVKHSSGHKAYLKEITLVLKQKENKLLFAETKNALKHLKKSILIIEKEMELIIQENKELKNTYDLVTSIKGIGNLTALFTIVYTDNFTRFKNARQFASFCGVAPFPNSSGTSLKGRTKVNNLANKKLKSLLDMGAKTAIQYNLEIKEFYNRRLEMGKNKMSTINIVRNKLISRMFAVVNRKSPYVDLMKYAA